MKQPVKRNNKKIDYSKGGTPVLKLTPKTPDFWRGFNFACTLLEDMGYTKSSCHPYNIADCLKGKMNRLSKNKIRKNTAVPYWKKKLLTEISERIKKAIKLRDEYMATVMFHPEYLQQCEKVKTLISLRRFITKSK